MANLLRKEWRLNPAVPGTGSITERLLAGRGLAEAAPAAAFLEPSLERLHDPFLLPDMAEACEVVAWAAGHGQAVVVHGDYDADGLTATALLLRFLQRIGVSCSGIIPDRIADGYGLSASGTDQVISSGAPLLITVDCGIASHEEIHRLKQAGIRVIVCDHHECQPELPEADAVINPKRADSGYPFADLAGVGVTLKLLQALCRKLDLGPIWQEDLDLVALGTVADVVPLVDENRILVTCGLKRLTERRHRGLAALLDAAGLTGKAVTSQMLGYALAPRLNAAGRLGSASLALGLLLTEDDAAAARLAGELAELNRRRQDLETQVASEAAREIDESFDPLNDRLLVVAREGWHQGIVGIVASRLAEQYSRPVIVLAGENGIYRGSGRSWGDCDLLAAIMDAAPYALKFGGHRKAAGVVVCADQLQLFREAVQDYARRHYACDPGAASILTADLEVAPGDLTVSLASFVERLAPFGEGNPQPLFICRDMIVHSVRQAGNGRHLKLQVAPRCGFPRFEAIAFGQADADEIYASGDDVDLLFALELNDWQGRRSLSLNIRDLSPGTSSSEFHDAPWIAERSYEQTPHLGPLMQQYGLPLKTLRPEREEYRMVYQFIRSHFGEKTVLADLTLLARWIGRSYRTDLNRFRLARILHVFEEIGLIREEQLGKDRYRLTMLPAEAKVRLEESASYCRLEAEGVDG